MDRYITCKTDHESRIEILAVDLQSFMDERDFVLMKVRRFHELRKLVLVIPRQFYLLGTDVEAMIGKIITVRPLATG